MHAMPSDVAFTPAVKAIQQRKGSRGAYARMERGRGWQTAITPDLADFLADLDMFYLGTANSEGQPYIQYRDGPPGSASTLVEEGKHRDIHGADAAREALRKSVTGLTRERARYIDQRLVAGDPAQALLDAVGANPANLIVVGNRGLGASQGQLLGSVPAAVVRNAVCDVLVVQTSALDEERMFRPAEGTADGAGPVAEADPGGRSSAR